MPKLNKRQNDILDFVRQNDGVSNAQIKDYLAGVFGAVSRVTVARDLSYLVKNGLVAVKGKGRSVRYFDKEQNQLLRFFDPDIYFQKGPDERSVVFLRFNSQIFKTIGKVFDQKEIAELKKFNAQYQKKIKNLPADIYQKELERLTIELSWKSSRIEGNTYSLLDTEVLIKEKKEAPGHKKEEVIMILNHKKALDYIFQNRQKFKKINLRGIEDIHRLLVDGLNVDFGLRKRAVGVIGTRYKPLDNQYQIKEAMDGFLRFLNQAISPFTKAFTALLLISYLRPFSDGNKRTARLLSNAILIAGNICPLSYRSVDEAEYKKALIIFYEQNSAAYFKKLFKEQFVFAVKNYF